MARAAESTGQVEASFFWYDLETTGTDPKADRIVQFAGVRTDLELVEVDEPCCTYVRCPVDVLPDPGACAVTGLTPQRVNREGMDELQAYVVINRCFSQPGTCVAGFNNLRFDDEFVRYAFYRHFIDPYAREWQGGNSRWDVIDLARAAYALRPDGIDWPTEDGLPTFRLADLAAANGIAHGNAHDALSDVRATIGVARLLRLKQRRLFDFYLNARDRNDVGRRLRLQQPELSLHVSRMFPRERCCIAPIMPLARHPTNRSSVIVVDLSSDPTPLIEWDSERLREALFGGDGVRPALKEVRLNRCPFVAPIEVLRDADARRLKLDMSLVRRRFETLRELPDLARKVAAIYEREPFDTAHDADGALYDGFFGDADRARCAEVLSDLLAGVSAPQVAFDDARLDELLFRLRARRDPDALTATERNRWQTWLRGKLIDGHAGGLTLAQYRQATDRLAAPDQLLRQLREHADRVEHAIREGDAP